MIDSRFEQAIRSPDQFTGLRDLAQRLLDEGSEPDAVIQQFEQVRQVLRRENRESDEDIVMEVMDFLTGWCSPHMKISKTPPSA